MNRDSSFFQEFNAPKTFHEILNEHGYDAVFWAKALAVKYRAKLSQGNGELCSKIEPLSVCYKLLRFITQRSPTWMLCM
ncbi:hypothetical protein, partial [Neisseria sp. WF04]|uniref:hypothetical protein n=2 Tax=unclassified Neisseria TaxID=2623750 RepID=UPI001ADD7DAE